MAEITSKTLAKKASVKASAAKAAPATKAAKAPAVKATKSAAPAASKVVAKANTAVAKSDVKKPAAPTKAPTVVVPKPVAKVATKAMSVSDAQRYRMVAEAAYYRAESNQFKSDPLRDWIEAESDIAALLSGSN